MLLRVAVEPDPVVPKRLGKHRRGREPRPVQRIVSAPHDGHSFDGPAHVVASDLTDPIYPTACSANQFVIRKDIAERLGGLGLSELEIEPLQIKTPSQ